MTAANLPDPESACLGSVKKGTPDWDRIAAEAARTVPGRENGGRLLVECHIRAMRVPTGTVIRLCQNSQVHHSSAEWQGCCAFTGNCDIKNLSRGSKVGPDGEPVLLPVWDSLLLHVESFRARCSIDDLECLQVYLPVFVEGGKLSVGDMHFSQGDGELSFCGEA